MVDSQDPTGQTLEPAGSASLATARRRTALAAVARPAAEVAGLLLVEVLGGPRARAAALGLARWLAGRRPPASASVEVTTRRVTVVQHADTSVLIPVSRRRWSCAPRDWPRGWPQRMSNAWTARDNSGKRMPS
jgi:hypothetical protein